MIFEARAVIFDLDGVLLDSEGANVDSAREVLRECDVVLDDADVRRVVGRHPVDYIPELLERHEKDAGLALGLIDAQMRVYDRLAAAVRLTPDAARIVDILRSRGLRLAVATASDARYARECLERGGILDAFETLCVREDVRRLKPDPEVYRLALSRLGLGADEALVVEDSGHGVSAAKAAGLRCLALRTPWVAEERLAAADLSIDSLLELDVLVGVPR